jgi:hypothetical protein
MGAGIVNDKGKGIVVLTVPVTLLAPNALRSFEIALIFSKPVVNLL